MYDYNTMKQELFREDNQKLFLAIRDQVNAKLRISGAVTMRRAIELPEGMGAAGSWEMMACVHRLVELGEIKEVTRDIFVDAKDRY